MTDDQIWQRTEIVRHTQRLLNSFRRWTGRPLMTPMLDVLEESRALFEAPFVVVSHGTEDPPILNYGNRISLKLWEMDWESFTSTPSRQTAEPAARAAREEFMRQVSANGFINNYSGIRISSTGVRFEIKDAMVWNVLDEQGQFCGQAATFDRWMPVK